MSGTGRILCRLDAIADPGGKGFRLDGPSGAREIFVIRRRRQVFGYVNSCPHVGTPLDWQPDQFLSLDKDLIQCSTHGARFEIESGRCVAGPCQGARLMPVSVVVEDGAVMLAEDPTQPAQITR